MTHRVRRGPTTCWESQPSSSVNTTRRRHICCESVAQFESLDAPVGACHAQVDLGLTLRIEGKLSAALNAYRQALRYQREYRFTTESADILEGLAAIAAALNRLDLAAKLCGTASGWRETYQEESWFPMPNDFHEVGR